MSKKSYEWARAEERALARYVQPDDLPEEFQLPKNINRLDLLQAEGPSGVLAPLYALVHKQKIQYDLALYNKQFGIIQSIRKPKLILDEGRGTCLDLAILFATMLIANDLLPLILIVEGHAFVGISLTRTRRSQKKSAKPYAWDKGKLISLSVLRELTEQEYLFVECTGAAQSKALSPTYPEGRGRDANGFMSFERACEAGREQVLQHLRMKDDAAVSDSRLFLYALDIHDLQVNHGFEPVMERKVESYTPHTGESARYKNLRDKLIQDVKGIWIKEYNDSLLEVNHEKAYIEIGMVYQPNAVHSPVVFGMHSDDKDEVPVDPGTKMLNLFNDARGTLVILGKPGSGKTLALLKLCQELLKQAEFAEPDDPKSIPVVLRLSTWKPLENKSLDESFTDWYENELKRYKLGNPEYRDNNMLIPLLDGIDDVNEEYRDSCVLAINEFVKKYSVQCAVTCRSDEYKKLSKLEFQKAVEVQRLTDQQVEKYLQKFKGGLTNVHRLLRRHPDSDDFIYSPLLLYILVLAYHNASDEDIKALDDARVFRKQLFTIYIEKRFDGYKNKTEHKNYSHSLNPEKIQKSKFNSAYTNLSFEPQKTQRWLSWLATAMNKHDKTVFYIEDLQPSWLLYSKIKRGLIIGLIMGLAFGLVFGLPATLFSGIVLVSGVGFQLAALIGALIIGLKVGWIPALVSGLVFGLVNIRSDDVGNFVPGNKLVFLFTPVRLILVLLLMVITGWMGWQSNGLIFGLVGMFFGAIGGILGVMVVGHPDLEQRNPGEGIRRTAINMSNMFIRYCLLGVLLLLLTILTIGFRDPWVLITFAPAIILFLGLFGGLIHGGIFLIQYYLSLILIHKDGHLPLNLVAFLETCEDCIFLRQVGGGYRFLHGMLMEHFAEMYQETEDQGV